MTNRERDIRSDEAIHEWPDVFRIQPDITENDCQGSFEGRGREKYDYASFERTQASENIILITGLAPGLSAVDTDIVLTGDNDMESESIATCRERENI